jgi:hypothetical protein
VLGRALSVHTLRDERVRVVEEEYKRRMALLEGKSTTHKYFYIEFNGFDQGGYANASMPALHADLFLKPIDPVTIESFRGWMECSTASHEHWSTDVSDAIENYAYRGFDAVWKAYQSGSSAVAACPITSIFDKIWQQPFVEDLPVGSVLFEGQGRHEKDILDLVSDGREWHDPFARKRPTSTSWVPAPALHFLASHDGPDLKLLKPPLAVWRDNNMLRIAAPGVKGFLRQTMLAITDQYFGEAEVMLMPNTKLVPTRGPEHIELPVRALNRVGVTLCFTNVPVYWVDVYPGE